MTRHTAYTAQSDGERTTTEDTRIVRVHCDGGFNVHILTDEMAARRSTLKPASGFINGISGGLSFTHLAVSTCQLGPHALNFTCVYAPEGDRTIISEFKLLDDHGIEVRKHPAPGHLLFPDGMTQPLTRINGHYFADFIFIRGGAL